MGRRFFDLKIDVYVPGRWYLSDPQNPAGDEIEDIWQFIQGKPVELAERLRIPLYQAGASLDFTTAGAGQAPIVSDRVASLFRQMAPEDIQLFPVDVEGEAGPFFLLNVAREIRCIDDAACAAVQIRTADEYTERVGEYRSVSRLRIDKAKVGDARVFRTWGWHAPIIVDEDLKDALEANGIFGGRFDEV
ncbi:imm11 family protein [Myxococcus faecalis]|uniref:imm11 family protein n=1 Tax=Myxococcus faecalis TaxID=3115646 RepID=UPI0038CF6F07